MFATSFASALKRLSIADLFAMFHLCFGASMCLSFNRILLYLLVLPWCLGSLLSADSDGDLIGDLMIVDYWNERINDRLPVTYNHLLQGGYFSMPSARMGCEGEIASGYAWVPPYNMWNVRCQLTNFLELSGSYRVFRGVPDQTLSARGFGDLSDKGANFKVALFSPEDSDYELPGLAFGMEDFLGTRAFKSMYVVLTKVWLDCNLEASLGYGGDRIRGVFGGIAWLPFRKSCHEYLRALSFAAEYDAIPYKDKHVELHPRGRVQKSPINFGLKYRLWDIFDFSAAYIRGDAFAFSGSASYNFGYMRGFLPKIDDPLPYTAPVVMEPLGPDRTENTLVQDLLYAFEEQGFDLLETWDYKDEHGNRVLRLRLINNIYRLECNVRTRITHVLANLVPVDYDAVEVVMEAEGFPIQEYTFWTTYLHEYRDKQIGFYELKVLSPMDEVTFPALDGSNLLFKDHRDWMNFEVKPRTRTFFGSSTGKFKYCLGISTLLNGYVWGDVYYNISAGYTLFQDIRHMSTTDILNPSQLIQVHTDLLRYYKQPGVTIDQMYLQKNWALGCGWYGKASLGYFEEAYAGLGSELLYYPVNGRWAAGIEGAVIKKRTIKGLGFTDKIRKLDGFQLTHRKFLGSQFFLNFYYELREASLDFKMALGKFLANDYGVRWELSRFFPSGLRITMWYTITNGHDHINGNTYYDKGVMLSMPFDIFYTHSDRSLWNYGMSAWLRDVGYASSTGESLYELISDQRE